MSITKSESITSLPIQTLKLAALKNINLAFLKLTIRKKKRERENMLCGNSDYLMYRYNKEECKVSEG